MRDGMAYFEVSCNGYKGIISNDGKWIIHTNQQYGKIEEIMDGFKTYYIVRKGNNNEYGLLDSDGKVLLSTGYDFLEVENGFVRYKIDGYYGVADTNGTTVIPTSRGYTYIGKYVSNEGIFHYSLPGYKGVCDNMGNELTKNVVEPQEKKENNNSSNTPVNTGNSSGMMNADNNSINSSQEMAKNVIQENESSTQPTPAKIVVEHKHEARELQPMQVWTSCVGCNGSGQCFICHGLGYMMNGKNCSSCHGRGMCTICAGNGGHNEIRYM